MGLRKTRLGLIGLQTQIESNERSTHVTANTLNKVLAQRKRHRSQAKVNQSYSSCLHSRKKFIATNKKQCCWTDRLEKSTELSGFVSSQSLRIRGKEGCRTQHQVKHEHARILRLDNCLGCFIFHCLLGSKQISQLA